MPMKRKHKENDDIPVDAPMQIVMGTDGSPHEPDDTCPICAKLAAEGIPLHTVDVKGEVTEAIQAPSPRWIEVTVEASAITACVLGLASFTEKVPAGCVASDFLAYLCFTRPDLADNYAPWELVLKREGRKLPGDEELRDGDRVIIRRRSIVDPA